MHDKLTPKDVCGEATTPCVTRSTKKTENHHGHQIWKTSGIFATIRKQDAKKQKNITSKFSVQNRAKIWPKLKNLKSQCPPSSCDKRPILVIFGVVFWFYVDPNAPGGWGGGDFHIKVTGMLVVLLWGVDCRFWSHLKCLGWNVTILAHSGIAKYCAWRNLQKMPWHLPHRNPP